MQHSCIISSSSPNFEKAEITTVILNLQVNHGKNINASLKSLKTSDNLSVNNYRKIKAIGSRSDTLNDLRKTHKIIADVWPPLRPIW